MHLRSFGGCTYDQYAVIEWTQVSQSVSSVVLSGASTSSRDFGPGHTPTRVPESTFRLQTFNQPRPSRRRRKRCIVILCDQPATSIAYSPFATVHRLPVQPQPDLLEWIMRSPTSTVSLTRQDQRGTYQSRCRGIKS